MSSELNKVGTRLKTNMQMEVKINEEFSIKVSHKDGLCDLSEIFAYGNDRRIKLGKPVLQMVNWLHQLNTCEFIQAHERLTYANTEVFVENTSKGSKYQTVGHKHCLKVGTSRVNKTRTDLLLTIKAAAYLDAELEVLIYTIFINQGILDLRDKGGDDFKRLNTAIDKYMPGREHKSSNKGLYINSAKKVRKGLGCESLADWNVQDADAVIHKQRVDVENRLIILLENGMVEGTSHLWLLIEKQCKLVMAQDL